MDECAIGSSVCDEKAVCTNLIGHYECSCRAPNVGNGKECGSELDCNACHANAHCVDQPLDGAQKMCVCNVGFVGNGFTCTPDDKSPGLKEKTN